MDVSTTFLDLLHSLRLLTVALLHFLGVKRIKSAAGIVLMAVGIYTICTSLANFNIVKSEIGTLLFFLGANILAGCLER
ncbi:MAG: hypothetical protein F4Z66_10575 [Gammaproteobacteria bacterium]|nr:hypothetical protein [Gammaproteobacteria bacterium]